MLRDVSQRGARRGRRRRAPEKARPPERGAGTGCGPGASRILLRRGREALARSPTPRSAELIPKPKINMFCDGNIAFARSAFRSPLRSTLQLTHAPLRDLGPADGDGSADSEGFSDCCLEPRSANGPQPPKPLAAGVRGRGSGAASSRPPETLPRAA